MSSSSSHVDISFFFITSCPHPFPVVAYRYHESIEISLYLESVNQCLPSFGPALNHNGSLGVYTGMELPPLTTSDQICQWALRYIIRFLSRFDAQKALSKNGMQLNGALIIGVKPVDPMQRQFLNDKLHNQGFMPIPPPSTTKKTDPIAFNASIRTFNQNGPTNTPHSGGTMASPAKSMVSKIVDLMFGL
ncbi:hypothetical protein E3N88_21369 [Mikania micrantha]|uniref:RRM Nup35-type domain-containing protein n=1 Tax=Mikania micrantha TaxID=192012 RepID=A0A5N6NJJ9_9ASTR|nr:hypothetical protein E3N88_21369 [Mikania micrantha]